MFDLTEQQWGLDWQGTSSEDSNPKPFFSELAGRGAYRGAYRYLH
jgi:hypothetical protein